MRKKALVKIGFFLIALLGADVTFADPTDCNENDPDNKVPGKNPRCSPPIIWEHVFNASVGGSTSWFEVISGNSLEGQKEDAKQDFNFTKKLVRKMCRKMARGGKIVEGPVTEDLTTHLHTQDTYPRAFYEYVYTINQALQCNDPKHINVRNGPCGEGFVQADLRDHEYLVTASGKSGPIFFWRQGMQETDVGVEDDRAAINRECAAIGGDYNELGTLVQTIFGQDKYVFTKVAYNCCIEDKQQSQVQAQQQQQQQQQQQRQR